MVLNLRSSIQDHNQKMTMKMVWMKMMSKEKHYVVLVVKTMHLMNSGSAVTYVRYGSMGSVLKSLLPGLSISSSTSVPAAVARELEFKICGTFRSTSIKWRCWKV